MVVTFPFKEVESMRRIEKLAITTSSFAYNRLKFPPGKQSRECSFGHDSWKLHRKHQYRTFGCHPAYRKLRDNYGSYRRNRS